MPTIRAKRTMTANQLAKELGVSSRTVKNYISQTREDYLAENNKERDRVWEQYGLSRTQFYKQRKEAKENGIEWIPKPVVRRRPRRSK